MKLSGRATGGAFGVIGRSVVVVAGDVIEETNGLGEDASGRALHGVAGFLERRDAKVTLGVRGLDLFGRLHRGGFAHLDRFDARRAHVGGGEVNETFRRRARIRELRNQGIKELRN